MRREFLGDLVKPFVELRLGAGVERGKRADNARLALRNDELGSGNDEQRRADDGQPQTVEKG